jgi:hypothetical protein
MRLYFLPLLLTYNIIRQGVIHLTTHRLAFHASLLATRPDLSPRKQVIRAGPAVIHRNSRWKRKRRVWMEISFDMLSTYSSSRDEDHIRPLRTVLCMSTHSIFATLLIMHDCRFKCQGCSPCQPEAPENCTGRFRRIDDPINERSC